MIDYDEGMLFVKANPDASSVDIAAQFGVTVAKAFTWCNTMIDLGLMYKTRVSSRINPKLIYGYRVIPGFDDEPMDEPSGAIRYGEALAILRRCSRVHGNRLAMQHLESMNEWRTIHSVRLIDPSDVPL